MLSWDEFDKEDEGEVAVKGANAGHATEANMDRLDAAGGVAAQEARAVTATDSAAIIRAKAALDNLDIAEGLAKLGFDIEKSTIRMPMGPIKAVGEASFDVALHTDVLATITVAVVGEQ